MTLEPTFNRTTQESDQIIKLQHKLCSIHSNSGCNQVYILVTMSMFNHSIHFEFPFPIIRVFVKDKI